MTYICSSLSYSYLSHRLYSLFADPFTLRQTIPISVAHINLKSTVAGFFQYQVPYARNALT